MVSRKGNRPPTRNLFAVGMRMRSVPVFRLFFDQRAASFSTGRSDLNAARISAEKSSGCSHAAKCPPLSDERGPSCTAASAPASRVDTHDRSQHPTTPTPNLPVVGQNSIQPLIDRRVALSGSESALGCCDLGLFDSRSQGTTCRRFVPYMCHGSAVLDGKGRYGVGSNGIRTQEKQSDRRQPLVLLWVFYRSARVRVPPWALQAGEIGRSFCPKMVMCHQCAAAPL